MIVAPLAPDETARLDALRELAILDTPPEREYDDLARLAAIICGTPISVISLVDRDRQWFKAQVGLDAAETSRDVAFCSHAILGRDLFVVPDAAADERFHDNPLVTGGPHIRFYAGAPLTTPEGVNLGTLCAIDRTPRTLTADQEDALRVLARQVVAQLVLRRQVAGLAAEVAERRKLEADLRESDERFRNAFDDAAIGMALVGLDGRWLRVNRAICEIVGYPPAELLVTDFQTLTHPADLDADLDLVRQLLAGDVAHYQMEKRYFHKAGHTVNVLLDVSLVRGAAGEPLYFVSQIQDVTARKQAADALRASEAKFRTTVDRLAEGVYVVDAGTRRFAEANATLLTLLGYTLAEFVALDPFDLTAGETPDVFARNAQEMDTALARDGRCDLGRRQFRRKDGSAFPVDLRVTVVPNGGAGLHAVIVRDVTEQVESENRMFEYQSQLEEANARLKALAVTDGLTGVKNRAAFNERLGEEFDRATRYGRPLSLILLDVDHFKAFNDAFGHPAGDKVLKSVAGTLQAVSRGTDVVTRYGGEEFAIILPDTDYAGAMVVAERCRRAVAGGSWDRRPVTASLGVGTLTPATPDAAALLADTDAALYRSKQLGRNRVSHSTGTVPTLATVRG